MQLLDLALPGGRTLQALDDVRAGTAAILVLHHGTLSDKPVPGDLVDAARRAGFRLVILIRPGYGGSTRQVGRRVNDIVPLVTVVADHLQAEHVACLGWAGGGPHAIATAAGLPGRCAAAMTVAGLGPFGAAGLEWLAGMGEERAAEFAAALDGPASLTAYVRDRVGRLDLVTPWPAGRDGDGWFDDDVASITSWGVDLDAVRVPLLVWHGLSDQTVPAAHSRWVAAHVRTSLPRLMPDEDHLTILDHLDAGLAKLREFV